MRWWLIAACALAALPARGQQTPLLASTPPALDAGAKEPSLESILQRLERLESENAFLRDRFDAARGAGIDDADPQPFIQQVDHESDDGEGVALCACNQPGCVHCRQNGQKGAYGRNSSGYPTLKWGGFLQLDSGWVSQDDANIAAVGDIQAQTGLRRVRLRASGRVHPDISYVVDLDFAASGHPSFRDVKFVRNNGAALQNVVVGYYQHPFGLDAMSSGRDLVLMERQLPFAFAPFRQPGLGSFGTAEDSRITWFHSGYAYPTNAFGVSEGDRGGWAYAGRVTALAFDDPEARTLWHLGGSYSFQDPGNDIIRYAIQPGFFVTDPGDMSGAGNVPVFVDTGEIPAQNVNLYGVETLGLLGPLSLQAEAVTSLVNPDVGGQLMFSAASAKLGYVLTGESHDYRRRRGVLGGVTPDNPTTSFFDPLSGAWEVTAAWAWIDLDDQSIQGGKMQTAILGLNRYMNSFTKLQLNVIRALLDDPVEGESTATVVALRAQAEF